LSDINMPGMDGLGLLQEVKRRNPELPVIMVTAYGDDERRRKASEFGAAEFVTKPVDFDLLKQQLQQLRGTLMTLGARHSVALMIMRRHAAWSGLHALVARSQP